MKVFIYNLREFDEKMFFDELKEEYGYDYVGVPYYQSLENIHEVKGCEAVSILASECTDDMLRAFAENGVKYLTTRSIGTDHINLKLAKELGTEEAALFICRLDKEYTQGFRKIRYERNSALPEGADCCEYRLRYDEKKN